MQDTVRTVLSFTPEQLADVASAFESAALGLAALVGGAWALFQFRVLKKVKKALSELEIERENTKLIAAQAKLAELQLERRGALTFSITHEIVPAPPSVSRAILVKVAATNIGNRTEPLNLAKTLLAAVPIRQKNGRPDLAEPQDAAVGLLAHRTDGVGAVEPGETLDFTSLVYLPSPGLYMLHFQSVSSREDIAEYAKALGLPQPMKDFTFNAHTVVAIP